MQTAHCMLLLGEALTIEQLVRHTPGDAHRVQSCMTLFNLVAPVEEKCFQIVLNKLFRWQEYEVTVEIVKSWMGV